MFGNLEKLLVAGELDRAREVADELAAEKGRAIDHYWAGLAHILSGSIALGRRHIAAAIEINEDLILSDFYGQLPGDRRAAALSADPEFDWLALQQAWDYFKLKEFRIARRISERALSGNAGIRTDGVRARLFEVYAESGMQVETADMRWQWLRSATARECARSGARPWVCLYQGCIDFKDGDLSAAQAMFEAAAAARYRLSHAVLGAFSFNPDLLRDTSRPAARPEPANNLRLAGADNTSVFVFSCDQRYFDRFARMLFVSSRLRRNRPALHFHVINPSCRQPVPAGLDRSQQLAWNSVGLSTERYDGPHRSYFACARFIRAAEFARWYSRPIVLADVDSCFQSDADDFEIRPEFDIALKIKRDENHYPWRSIVADFVAFRPTDRAIRFLGDVGSYCLQFLKTHATQSWWLDQNALALVHHRWSPGPIRILNFYDGSGLRKLPLAFAPQSDDLKAKFVAEWSEGLGACPSNAFE